MAADFVGYPQNVGPNGWLLCWESDAEDPVFRIGLNGREVLRTRRTSHVFPFMPSEAAVLEVLDDDVTEFQTAVDPRAIVSFDSVADTTGYRVERKVGAVWTNEAGIREAGVGRQAYNTPPLADGETHEFRVTPIGNDGNEGTATETAVAMDRHPNPPIASWTYEPAPFRVVTFSDASWE